LGSPSGEVFFLAVAPR